jgi:hypothetical protein
MFMQEEWLEDAVSVKTDHFEGAGFSFPDRRHKESLPAFTTDCFEAEAMAGEAAHNYSTMI